MSDGYTRSLSNGRRKKNFQQNNIQYKFMLIRMSVIYFVERIDYPVKCQSVPFLGGVIRLSLIVPRLFAIKVFGLQDNYLLTFFSVF